MGKESIFFKPTFVQSRWNFKIEGDGFIPGSWNKKNRGLLFKAYRGGLTTGDFSADLSRSGFHN